MQVQLPWEVFAILQVMAAAGFEAYVVGGAVRDTLLGKISYDWDFTTNARPEQIQALFAENFYENNFGTVGVAREHLWQQFNQDPLPLNEAERAQVYELTTFRTEGAYSDFRRPDEVKWGETLEDDLKRRDFTINALAFALPAEELEKSLEFQNRSVDVKLIDPFGGLADLQRRVLRTVGDPGERFREDALRMMRAIRFAAQLEMRLDPETVAAIQENSGLIAHVSWERIRDEFLKIIVTDHVEDALTLMYTTELLKYVLPELLATRGVEQRGHHEWDVWTHTLRACEACPSRDPVVRLAALLHDIAKPETQEEIPDADGEYSFHNHEVVGARLARDIAQRLRLSKGDCQRIFTLVRWHMFHYQPQLTDAAIRRFIRRVGLDNIEAVMALREGDRIGSGSKRTSWRLEEMKQRIHDQLHQPMKVSDLVVKGEDVMRVLGIPPSRQVGQTLDKLFEEVLDDPAKNNRDYLLSRLQSLK
jgi:putative nucleotidyltransferase with HDIG domain